MDSSQEQIIALTTQVKALKLSAVKPPSDQSKKNGGNKGNPLKDTDATKGTARKGVKGSGTLEWKITNKGTTMKHPDTGIGMVWYPRHVSQDRKVNGMYMTIPQNHDEWQTKKDAGCAAWKASVKERKKASAYGSKESPAKKSKTGPNHLALSKSKSFTLALCTNFMCSESDAENILQQMWNESHCENEEENDKDDSSKE